MSAASPATPPVTAVQVQSYKLPLYFIENHGQAAKPVRYYLHGGSTAVYFTTGGMTVALMEPRPRRDLTKIVPARHEIDLEGEKQRKRWAVKLEFLGARKDAEPEGIDKTEAIVSYFKGPKEDWKTGLPTFAGVRYSDLWPGIDLVFEGRDGRLKSNFVVHPGADPSLIKLAWRGASKLSVSEQGRLGVETPAGGFAEEKPFAYQETGGGGALKIASGYQLRGEEYGFELGSYDRQRQLVIDPLFLFYAGYIGGVWTVGVSGIAVDAAGNAYVTGETDSTEATFPVTVGPDLTHNGGACDALVAKVNAAGTALVYAGYIGGSGCERGSGIAVDGAGNAYVTGETSSDQTTFPETVGPDLTFNGFWDAFVAKVNAAGTALVYAGYIGGSGHDSGLGIAVDVAGNAYVTGQTQSSEATFPVMVGPDLTYNGVIDAFVAKVNAAGTALTYSGFIGGSMIDWGSRIALDPVGNAYVSGYTSSDQATFPVTVGPDLTFNGGFSDVFVAKVNTAGNALAYAGYIGGSGLEVGSDIAVDAAGSAYVTGITSSTEATFPVTVGPDLTFNGGPYDAFVAKVNPAGTALAYAGYIGGSATESEHGLDSGSGIAVDTSGNAYVSGYAYSSEATFPVVVGPDLTFNGGFSDAFVAKVNAAGTGLIYAGYIGGSGDDGGAGIAVDGAGNAYVAGNTGSDHATFPVTVGPDLTFNGNHDTFIAKISSALPTAALRDSVSSYRLLTRWNSPEVFNAGGLFASDPTVAQTANGNTVIVGRDSGGSLRANVFNPITQTFSGWTFGGGITQGIPAVAMGGDGNAHIAARDNFNSYWIASYTPGISFGAWTYVAGIFSADPAIAACPDGSLYIIGRDAFNSLWSGRYIPGMGPGSGFQGWRFGGGIIQGKPSVACGKDNVAYVAIRDNWNSLWIARVSGNTWLGWSYGGGIMSGDPQVAAARDGTVYAVVRDPGGAVWYRGYTEGSANGWLAWVNAGGILQDFSASGELGEVYVAGRSPANQLWWYRLGANQWTHAGNFGVAAGPLSAAPR